MGKKEFKSQIFEKAQQVCVWNVWQIMSTGRTFINEFALKKVEFVLT